MSGAFLLDLVEWRDPAAGVLGDAVLLDVLVNDGLLFSFQEILQRIVKIINFGACILLYVRISFKF